MRKVATIWLLTAILLIGAVYALPTSWFGDVSIGGESVNGTLVVPYDAATCEVIDEFFNPPSGVQTPFGVYNVDVVTEVESVFFKVNETPTDQGTQDFNQGLNELDLTVTDDDGDNFSQGFEGYFGLCGASDFDCDDSNASIWQFITGFTDNDTDGFGEDATAVDVCSGESLPSGFTAIGGDNCPIDSNPDQADSDSDTIGDVCDDCPEDAQNDADSDTICGNVDNCPVDANQNQSDADSDGIGDVCDTDRDGDTVSNEIDNCPDVANTDQADLDNDSAGDVCDADIDGDGTLNEDDTIVGFSNAMIGSKNLGIVVDSTVDPDTRSGSAKVMIFNNSENETDGSSIASTKVLVEFNYSFSNITALDLRKVNVTNNPNGVDSGSIIVNGINLTGLNITKTVYIDNVKPSNTICVIDTEFLASVVSISGDCTNGVKLICDGGASGQYECTSVENSTRYAVSGLTHSAISEYEFSASPVTNNNGGGGGGGGGGAAASSCVPDWSCTEWSVCSGGTQTRSCTDLNDCASQGIFHSTPEESQSCTEPEAQVTPDNTDSDTQEDTTPVTTTATDDTPTVPPIGGQVIADVDTEGQSSLMGIIVSIVVLALAGGYMYTFVYRPRQTPHGRYQLATKYHQRAQAAHKAGNHTKARSLYEKADKLRQKNDKLGL